MIKEPSPSSAGAGASSPLVLVVDDYDDNRELYATALADAGYHVEQAADGQEALDKIGARRPAVVIMDLSMPVLDGWEATRRIKGNQGTSDIFVIAVTGHGTNFGLQRASDAGADAVLTKPCLPEEIIEIMRALIPPT